MTKIIDAKPDPSIRALTDAEVVHVAGAGLELVVQPQISKTLVAAIERLKSELRVALPRF
jgi:hypothetical protein